MRDVSKTISMLILLLLGTALGRYSCRLCTGYKRISFLQLATQEEATSFFEASLGSCASGNEYDMRRVQLRNCHYAHDEVPTVCQEWTFTVDIPRYCKDGDLVSSSNGQYCIGSTCATSDTFSLTCQQKVLCPTTCDPSQC